ncbi:MAG: hypothetical protein JWM77_2409, partial [Rhodospirillales bacterium]|nr:hypothetical protein [Rhodospirillales bacterium]
MIITPHTASSNPPTQGPAAVGDLHESDL